LIHKADLRLNAVSSNRHAPNTHLKYRLSIIKRTIFIF